MRRCFIGCFVLAMLATCQASESWELAKAQFEKQFYNENPTNKINLKNEALLGLMTPDWLRDARAVDLMYSVIEKAETWFDIGLALTFFTKATGKARERLSADLADPKSGLSPRQRETIAFMLSDYARYYGKLPEAEQAVVLAALADAQVGVRRYAARAVQGIPTVAGVDALLAQWAQEKDVGVISYLVDSLRQVTGKQLSRDLDEWKSWRTDNPEPELQQGFKDSEWVTGSYGDFELEFETGTGAGRPIWVLPPFGLQDTLYRPGLSVLEPLGALTYIKLPLIGKDIVCPKSPEGMDCYPVDALVAALEVLREERKEPKVILLGCLDSSYILLRYAQLHPDRVVALIIVSGWLDGESYTASFELLKQNCSEEEQLYAEAAHKVLGVTPSDSQNFSIIVGRLASTLKTPADVYGCFVWEKFFDIRQPPTVLLPPVVLDKKAKIEVPSLFLHGADDRMNSYKYTSFQGKLYLKPRPVDIEIANSGPLPWHDNPAEFFKQVEKFLSKVK